MQFRYAIIFLGIIIALALTATINPTHTIPTSQSAAAQALPNPPAGLKNYFMVGLANSPGDFNWMTSSGVPWDARYQYLSAGVNTGSGWATWNSPAGQFASYYMSDSAANGYTPIFTYYQLIQSAPNYEDYSNLNNASTMKAYYADFKLLLDKIKAFGKTTIVHVEPDLWGFLQQRNSNPNNITASVASSGYGDVVASQPNTVSGFAKALVALRDKYAPNALLAWHISPWASTYGDLSSDNSSTFNVAGAAQQTANFYLQTGANFDLMFYDIADRDAALYQSWGDPNRWWDTTNSTYPNFNRFHQFVAAITTATGKRGMLWQVPLGNTVYRTMNNKDYHWQDNKAQYYLNGSNQHIQDAVNSGLMGIFFGSGGNTATVYTDAAGDAITNPNPINGNTQTSNYSDDDGGYIRVQAAAYYNRGPVTFGNPTLSSTPAPGNTLSISANVGSPASASLSLRNSGGGGAALTVSAPALSGANPSLFSVSPNSALNMAAGSPATTVTIQCNPTGRGNFSAKLTYTTNDPARPQVSYFLACTGLAPKFSSTPYQPGATVSMSAAAGQAISTTLGIDNGGSPGTTLNVGTATLNQTVPGVFAVAPTTNFTLAKGATRRTVTITCTPPVTGLTYTGTLTFPVSNDPDTSSASFNLSCKGLTPLPVTSSGDSGLGTFKAAVDTYVSGVNIITFSVSQVNLNAGTSLNIDGGAVVIDGGSCNGGQPGVTITGGGKTNTITLGAGVELRNLWIKNFGPITLNLPGGGNKLTKCLKISKN